ncbi:heptaprenylglyceryl phosphate synthase [Evansella cellulosilytica]|uniref:Heptaprenylglyceryl phosphate synthase n=1 Tax=Evansella cellulosilytica (strain ATCC 21833 / DSM 2522 / FERM P-1141 / JCM 9156 / N-4) TaxID=649639 RepID=E6TWM9_EVAC2|nr:heptaprenylglyceryl phosphate synthase [Evansella cellulosilytica]ADU28712.1 geranylgeranylglyceryl phosphate synthase family protein [Evansella cellulosilytica DSM 2522]
MKQYKEWKHAFKLDPNKEISDEDLELLCESGTDGIIVGGSDGVTEENTIDLLMRIRRYSVACALEVSNLYSIVPGYDYYFIPSVVNTTNATWINGLHHRALKEYGHLMNWDEVVTEGYCVLNQSSKVAQLTDANTELDSEDVIAYARMADKLFHMPVFYLEYSGKYGDPDIVAEVKYVLEHCRLFYGGGIESFEQAKEMAQHADTIIVGNVIYTDIKEALKTVNAVQE